MSDGSVPVSPHATRVIYARACAGYHVAADKLIERCRGMHSSISTACTLANGSSRSRFTVFYTTVLENREEGSVVDTILFKMTSIHVRLLTSQPSTSICLPSWPSPLLQMPSFQSSDPRFQTAHGKPFSHTRHPPEYPAPDSYSRPPWPP